MPAKADVIRVVVEFDAESEPIQGSVLADHGERPFSGWMQLTAALEHARAAAGVLHSLKHEPANQGAEEE
jgi:hypothetical protein